VFDVVIVEGTKKHTAIKRGKLIKIKARREVLACSTDAWGTWR